MQPERFAAGDGAAGRAGCPLRTDDRGGRADSEGRPRAAPRGRANPDAVPRAVSADVQPDESRSRAQVWRRAGRPGAGPPPHERDRGRCVDVDGVVAAGPQRSRGGESPAPARRWNQTPHRHTITPSRTARPAAGAASRPQSPPARPRVPHPADRSRPSVREHGQPRAAATPGPTPPRRARRRPHQGSTARPTAAAGLPRCGAAAPEGKHRAAATRRAPSRTGAAGPRRPRTPSPSSTEPGDPRGHLAGRDAPRHGRQRVPRTRSYPGDCRRDSSPRSATACRPAGTA